MKPFKHEIQKGKWDQLRKKRLLHGFLISGCCTLAFTGVGVGVGYALWHRATTTSAPPVINPAPPIPTDEIPDAKDVPYLIDGSNWNGNIQDGQHLLGKTYADKFTHRVEYEDPGTIDFENGMVFPDFVKDTNSYVYAVCGIGTNTEFNGRNATIKGMVQLPKYLFQIGTKAFWGATTITGFDFSRVSPIHFHYIGENAFIGCTIRSIIPGGGLVSISDDFGSGCIAYALNGFKPLDDDGQVLRINRAGCGGLIYGSIVFSSSVKSIGNFAFSGDYDSATTDIWGARGITGVDFRSCPFSFSFQIKDFVGSFAFAGTSIQEINWPDFDIGIGENAFSSCRMTSLTISIHTKKIQNYAFANCHSLNTVYIENVDIVRYYSNFVFGGCKALSRINVVNDGPSFNMSGPQYVFSDINDSGKLSYVITAGATYTAEQFIADMKFLWGLPQNWELI